MAKKKTGLPKQADDGNVYRMIQINGQSLPTHVSYSSLTTWLDCGWKYYLSRIANTPEPPTWYFIGGTALHTATELYDKQVEGVAVENAE